MPVSQFFTSPQENIYINEVFKKLTRSFGLLTLTILVFLFLPDAANSQTNPLANPASVIKAGNARFTVLTDGLIRMEWDSAGIFEDHATQIILNRFLKKPHFTATYLRDKLIIATSKFKLKYLKSNKRFNPTNLHLSFMDDGIAKTWDMSVKDTGNLKGTGKTLDNYNGDIAEADHKTKLQLEDGLLSTSGWFLLNDAGSYLLDNSAIPWVKERRTYKAQDFYFFCYGKDYKTALLDYTKVAGKVPLPPEYAFGYWWSRYYAYSDDELRTLIGKFEYHDIPLDVLVIDMDWHPTYGAYEKNPRRDLSGSRRGWTGYTWNRDLFPEPGKFLNWTADHHLKVTLNLHPASGIPFTEEKYARFAQVMHFDTTGKESRRKETDNIFAKWPVFDPISYKDIMYEGTNKKYINTLFDLVLHPLEKQGVDFWWLDWQQYKYDKVFKNLDNTWWLNHVFFHQMQQQHAARPLIYHRWGGLGNHRYQIGFSGDASITWKTLAYEPYFTTTAANVLYGYWSHDIGGHIKTRDTTEDKTLATNPELYMRWLQYGVFSPILRTHSTQGLTMSREPWEFQPKYGDIISQYIHLRYALAPYIYTMARKTFDTGISICRPLYYDYPNDKESYLNKSEYFFGDDMLVAPIAAPSVGGLSTVNIWLPKGNWVELCSGEKMTGGKVFERDFRLDEYPVYIKEGAVIPTYPHVRNLKFNCDTIILKIYGKGHTSGSMYEDEGDNDRYLNGRFAKRTFITAMNGAHSQSVEILPGTGNFSGMSSTKAYVIEFCGVAMPVNVKINGKAVPNKPQAGKSAGWLYLPNEVETSVSLPKVKFTDKLKIEVNYPMDEEDTNGLQGKMKKAKEVLALIRAGVSIDHIPKQFFAEGELALNISYHPENYQTLVKNFLIVYREMPVIIQKTSLDIHLKDNLLRLLQ